MDINFSQTGQNIAVKEGNQQLAPLDKAVNEGLKALSSQELSQQADRLEVKETDLNEIESAINEIRQFVETRNRDLSFSIDEKSDRPIVKITDSQSGDIIRQIPSEEVLALSERLRELQTDVGAAVGVLLNNKA